MSVFYFNDGHVTHKNTSFQTKSAKYQLILRSTQMINIEKKTVSSPCPRCMLSYVSMYVPHVYRRVLVHHELTRLIYQEIELLMTITSFLINVKVIRVQQAELFLMQLILRVFFSNYFSQIVQLFCIVYLFSKNYKLKIKEANRKINWIVKFLIIIQNFV